MLAKAWVLSCVAAVLAITVAAVIYSTWRSRGDGD
jgi:hypothetical protein